MFPPTARPARAHASAVRQNPRGAASDDVPRLVFDIFDKDMMSSDDQMGTATVRLRDMFLDANADPSSTAAPRDGDVADGAVEAGGEMRKR